MRDHYPKDEEQNLRSALARFGVNEGKLWRIDDDDDDDDE